MSPEQKAAALDAKNKGNAAFSAGQFAEAVTHFTAAIAADPTDHIFFSNRRRATRSSAAAARLDLCRRGSSRPQRLDLCCRRAVRAPPDACACASPRSACYASLNESVRSIEVRKGRVSARALRLDCGGYEAFRVAGAAGVVLHARFRLRTRIRAVRTLNAGRARKGVGRLYADPSSGGGGATVSISNMLLLLCSSHAS